MIIKVVEVVEKPDISFYDETSGTINSDSGEKFTLCETYLNTEHIISFREIELGSGELPEGLDKRQKYTHVAMSKARSGMIIVNSPAELQTKIQKGELELLKG